MSERVELTGKELEDVVGGAFHFQYNSKGKYVCRVDGVGAYYADESAKRKINLHDIEMGGLSTQELVDWALSEKLFWEP